MRADVVRLYRAVHSWAGILTGLILFVAFYAGAITMFKEPIERWATPPIPMTAVSLEQGSALIAGVLAVRPDAAQGFTLALTGRTEEERILRLTWQKTRNDPAPWSATLASEGGVVVERLRPAALGRLVDVVHRTAGIPGDLDLGTAVTGVASAVYAVALVSGVIILLPSLVKDLFAFRVGSSRKRMWLDAHNIVGIFSLPFHMVIALTAVIFGLHDFIYGAQDHVVYRGELKTIMAASTPSRQIRPDPQPAAMLPPETILAQVRSIAPGFMPVSLQYHNAGTQSALVRVWGKDPRYLVRNMGFLLLSPVTGAVIDTEYLPGHQGEWSASVSSFFALHFGTFGGETIRWGYFFLGLAGAFLFYSGNRVWVESRCRVSRQADWPPAPTSRPAILMAAATTGVCLGCVSGLSLTMAAGKWLYGTAADLDAWHWGLYYGVFLAACGWAFHRGVARAGVELLWLASATTAAIPATTALAWVVPGLGLWVSGGVAGLAVDLVALAGALIFAWMARMARARQGTMCSN